MNKRVKDISGQRFGRLQVVGLAVSEMQDREMPWLKYRY